MHITTSSELVRKLPYTHSSEIATALSFVIINSLAWLALNKSAANVGNVLVYGGDLAAAPKATGEAWTLGAKLYWDASAGKFTTTSTSNTLCGRAGAAAASADTTGSVIFNTFEQ
jgi:predicted RecA/RadA family phage recombinase